MTSSELNELFERVQRLSVKLEDKNGDQFQWDAILSDGTEVTYVVKNLKNLNDLQDEISNLFIWTWNIKDYLKEFIKKQGLCKFDIERMVNRCESLSVCADLANRLKHGNLSKSRSGHFPRLGKMKLEAGQEAFSSIAFREKEVEFDFSNPQLVKFSVPVISKTNKFLGDGFNFVFKSIDRWEEYFEEIKNAR